jgi:hypothetical protein
MEISAGPLFDSPKPRHPGNESSASEIQRAGQVNRSHQDSPKKNSKNLPSCKLRMVSAQCRANFVFVSPQSHIIDGDDAERELARINSTEIHKPD